MPLTDASFAAALFSSTRATRSLNTQREPSFIRIKGCERTSFRVHGQRVKYHHTHFPYVSMWFHVFQHYNLTLSRSRCCPKVAVWSQLLHQFSSVHLDYLSSVRDKRCFQLLSRLGSGQSMSPTWISVEGPAHQASQGWINVQARLISLTA